MLVSPINNNLTEFFLTRLCTFCLTISIMRIAIEDRDCLQYVYIRGLRIVQIICFQKKSFSANGFFPTMIFKCWVYILISSSFAALLNAEFVCPNPSIKKDYGLTGAIPSGATSMVKVPAGTSCTYLFDIPKGYAMKVETSAIYDASHDVHIKFDYFYIASPAVKEVEYAVNQTLAYEVVSVTGNLTFSPPTHSLICQFMNKLSNPRAHTSILLSNQTSFTL